MPNIPMPDPIYFTIKELVPLVEHPESPLTRCTQTRWDDNAGAWQVERLRAILSTGEEILWEILATLAKRDQIGADLARRAANRLDPETFAIAEQVALAVGDELARDNAEQAALEADRDARWER